MPAKEEPSSKPGASLSDYLAAERTFLAWIRTGLALMGFGFVIARFGLFLEELRQVQGEHVATRRGLSPWFGTAVILLGVVVNGVAAWNHSRLVGRLNRGMPERIRASPLAIVVALLLALIGLGLAVYLASVGNSPEMK